MVKPKDNLLSALIKRKQHFILVGALIFVGLVAFYHSFRQIFRYDDWVLFYVCRHQDAGWPTIIKYIISMSFAPEPFFKPLAFFWHAFIRSVFGVNYFYDHIVGFLLHTSVALLCLKILRSMGNNIFAYLFAALFLVSFTGFDTVVNTSTTYLLLQNIFILTAGCMLWKVARDQQVSSPEIIFPYLLIMLASFFNESGCVLGIFFAGFLVLIRLRLQTIPPKVGLVRKGGSTPSVLIHEVNQQGVASADFTEELKDTTGMSPWSFIRKTNSYFNAQDKKAACAMGAISLFVLALMALYLTSFRDAPLAIRGHEENFINAETFVMGGVSVVDALAKSVLYLLLPLTTQITFQDTVHFGFNRYFSGDIPQFIGWLVAALLVVMYLRYFTSIQRIKERKGFLWLAFLFLFFYLFPIAVGRTATSGSFYVATQSRYLYLVNIAVIFLIYSCVDFQKAQKANQKIIRAAGLLLILLIFFHGYRVFGANRELARLQRPLKIYFDQISRFVAAHKSEKDFSFTLSGHPSMYLPMQQKDELSDFPYGVSTWGAEECIVGPFYKYLAGSIRSAKYFLAYERGRLMAQPLR